MVRAAVVGAAGYAGIELVRLLLGHPDMELTCVTSAGESGREVGELYPALAGCGLVFTDPDSVRIAAAADVAFLAVPHTASLALAPTLLASGLTVVDLSADYRLHDPAVYEAWYGVPHTSPGLLAEAVYGLPELTRDDLRGARLIACAGCYPTASALAAAPALASGLAGAGRVIIDAKSGVSGAGRTPSVRTHFCAADESVQPYSVGTHRHTPEIAQTLSAIVESSVEVCFTPHLVPMTRGLLATVYLQAAPGVSLEDAHAAYTASYADEPFVRVVPLGQMPSTHDVCGGNRAHIGVALDEGSGTLIVACAIDNLVKGSGGQALQCANVALGLEETAGLTAWAPVV